MRRPWSALVTILAIILKLHTTNINAQKNPHFMHNRTTMVHLFEWKWVDIAKECEEFLGPKNYGGVQISPPNEHRVIAPMRPWWERYQPISYQLNSRSGNEAELRDMIARCQRVGVRIYVDAIINHMSAKQPGMSVGTAGSIADYDQQLYAAVPYVRDDFNAPCSIANYSDPVEVRNCQLNSLLDLNQSKPHVRQAIVNYMNRLLDMGVAGFRIDAAKHMWPTDLNAIYGKLRNLNVDFGFPADARPYIYQEVIDLGGETIQKTDYNQLGDVTEFKYSAELGRAFRGKNDLKWLKNWGSSWGLLPDHDAVVFVDNHDNQRGHGAGGADILTFKDGEIYELAVIFMLAHPYGEVTRIMSSYAFNDTDQGPPTNTDGKTTSPSFLTNGLCNILESGWICEHRWPAVVKMVEFRNLAAGSSLQNWWDNGGNQIAFGRGKVGFVAFNNDAAQPLNMSLQTGLPAGTYCDILSGEKQGSICIGKKFSVSSDGMSYVELPKGPSVMAIHVAAMLDMGQKRGGS